MVAYRDANRTFRSGKAIRPGGATLRISGAVGEIREAALRGLRDAAKLVFDESQQQVPVLAPNEETPGRISGELKKSGSVDVNDATMVAAIRYGTEYAVYQHERMDLKHPSGGNAKFLEQPLIAMREQALEMVADEIRKVTEK